MDTKIYLHKQKRQLYWKLRKGNRERETRNADKGTGHRERRLGSGSLGIQNWEFEMAEKGKEKGTISGNVRKWASWNHSYFDNNTNSGNKHCIQTHFVL